MITKEDITNYPNKNGRLNKERLIQWLEDGNRWSEFDTVKASIQARNQHAQDEYYKNNGGIMAQKQIMYHSGQLEYHEKQIDFHKNKISNWEIVYEQWRVDNELKD